MTDKGKREAMKLGKQKMDTGKLWVKFQKFQQEVMWWVGKLPWNSILAARPLVIKLVGWCMNIKLNGRHAKESELYRYLVRWAIYFSSCSWELVFVKCLLKLDLTVIVWFGWWLQEYSSLCKVFWQSDWRPEHEEQHSSVGLDCTDDADAEYLEAIMLSLLEEDEGNLSPHYDANSTQV